jgi:hypothetical protein
MCCIISVLFSSKFRLFHNSTLFGSCIIYILNTGCAKIKKKKLRRQRVKISSGISHRVYWEMLTKFRKHTLKLSSLCLAVIYVAKKKYSDWADSHFTSAFLPNQNPSFFLKAHYSTLFSQFQGSSITLPWGNSSLTKKRFREVSY